MHFPRRTFLVPMVSLAVLVTTAGSAFAHGVLIPRQESVAPLSLKHQRVHVDVKDGVAVTRVEQVFVNSTRRPLEATYVFPVPKGAAITDFKLLVNGRMQRGEMLDRAKAERIYQDIVRRVKDPGIVDWMSETLFRARIFPVPPRGQQRLSVTYSQPLAFKSGTYKLVYPLKTASQRTLTTLEDFTVTVKLAHSVPIKSIYSPSHRIAVSRKGEYQATVGFEGDRVALDKDFVVYFGVSPRDVGLTLLTHRPAGEAGYFLLAASPKNTFDTKEIQGKAITFVLDTSGSMNGAKLSHAKKALIWALNRLGSDDRFNVIRFSSDVEPMASQLMTATSDNVAQAVRFVRGFEAAGGTAIDDALLQALGTDAGPKTPHMVMFITDGKPTIGETQVPQILSNARAANRHRARVFAFGVGEQLHTHLLDKLAAQNRGTTEYVKPNEDIEVAIGHLYDSVAYPVLSDLRLDLSDAGVYAMLPKRPSDLFRGQQLLMIGRYRGHGDKLIRLQGNMAGAAQSYDFEGTFPARSDDHSFIAQLWAHRQVGFLLDQVRLNGERPELRQEIIRLAKRFGIVTPYTSYLVVEDVPLRPEPRPPRRPMLLRRGKGFSGGSATPPAPTAAEQDAAETAKKRDVFRAPQGSAGVRSAKTVRRLKDTKRAESQTRHVRYAAGRAFRYTRSGWEDTTFTAKLPKLVIAPYSSAWMQLARANPALRPALALGERVTIVVAGRAIVIGPSGKTTLSRDELKRLSR